MSGNPLKIIASLVLYRHSYSDIAPTLNSLLSEKSIDKVCIVDNGGHCDWVKTLTHIKIDVIILPVNRGFGAGHNQAFQRFKNQSNYILICNPDIIFSQGEIDKLYKYSIESKLALSIPKVVYPDGALQHGCKLLPTPSQLFMRRFLSRISQNSNAKYELHHADYSRPFFAPSLSGCFILISNEALQEVKGFDERFFLYLEDVDLSRRVCLTGLSVRYCPYATVVHESQRRSYKNLKFLFLHINSAVRYFNKWGWFRDAERDLLNARCLTETSDCGTDFIKKK
ncbi:glycosyltransferase family 2 protein [Pantoea sp.]|uniref:glycosyltransferase family 2 protein n=1 Tax=Pantoea sp. TaxID=69393 RepID=UPI0028B01040|nr:glycosyltransferase family 2 protein [Pantoea sp.]